LLKKDLVGLLRAVLVLAALAGGLAAFWVAPTIGKEFAGGLPEAAWLYWPCLIWIWVLAGVYFWGVGVGFGIVGDIARDRSFTGQNAARLMLIAKLALTDAVLVGAGTAALLAIGYMHPGVLMLFAAVMMAGLAMTVVSASLSRLTEKAALLQSESDLTV